MPQPTCYPKTTLKKYLAGWADDEESSCIEAHLTECDQCEKTLTELESEPETLLEFLAGANPVPSEDDPLVGYALSKAKQLANEPQDVTTDVEPSSLSIPPTLGPYDVLRPIGQGSMGRVYLARHRQLMKLVAIKVFAARAFRSPQFATRFEREVRAAGALQHPAIINATDAGQADSLHYLVMEYIEGLDLSRLARIVGPLSIGDACAIGQAIALGLDHAHAAGIVHRDIKPSNVMLSLNGQVKLLDFGLAQTTMWDEASAELTTVGQLMGTIDYMAPEQAERAESVDYRADLYALGATLFRLMCGRAPLAASPNLSPLARLRLLATSSPPLLRTLRPDAPVELEKLLSELLARDPEGRPASAAHVAEQLSRFAGKADLSSLIRTAHHALATRVVDSSTNFQTANIPDSAVLPPRGRMRRWLVAAAAGAIGLAAVVLITLETQKGQVVIESKDANVVVELSKDGRVRQAVSITPGATSTRIAAGQYDVSIAAGSDQFELDHDAIEIKRGETVIARVRQLPKKATVDAATRDAAQHSATLIPGIESSAVDVGWQAAISFPSASERLFDGKTLSQWLVQLEREISVESTKKALEAITALGNEQDREYAAISVLKKYPLNYSGDSRELFNEIFAAAGDWKRYFKCIATVLPEVDDARATDLLLVCRRQLLSPPKEVKKDLANLLAPLTTWSEDVLRREQGPVDTLSPARRKLVMQVGTQIVDYLVVLSQTTPPQREREQQLVDTLLASPVLDKDFWLQIPDARTRGADILDPRAGRSAAARDRTPFPTSFATALEERATDYFLGSDDKQVICAATVMLSFFNEEAYLRAGMPPLRRRSEIVKAIGNKLREMVKQSAMVSEFVELEAPLSLIHMASLWRVSPRIYGGPVTISNAKINQVNPCLQLLYLAETLNAESELEPELNALLAVVEAPAAKFAARFATASSRGGLAIPWPDVTEIKSTWSSSPTHMLGHDDWRVDLTSSEVLSTFVFSQLERMLPIAKLNALIQELPAAIKSAWLDQQMKLRDVSQDGQLQASELKEIFVVSKGFKEPAMTLDKDGDNAVSRAELQTYYEDKVFSR